MPEKTAKVEKLLAKNGFGNICAREWRHSIVLEGESDNWSDIVKAGKLAAKFGYKGVVNDVSLRGFTEPAVRRSAVEDGAIDGSTPDVLIIGGGVIGCATARELSKLNVKILLVDKESDVAMQASSRNDGMIHPGIASHPGTLRGELNVKGNAMYTKLCEELNVPFKRLSNFILYDEPLFGVAGAAYLGIRAKLLGIEGKKLSREEMHRLEPNITDSALGAFEYPSSGVLSPYKLTVALAESAVQNGATVSLDTIVTGMEVKNSEILSVYTNRGTVHPKVVINAAGTFSDKIAGMANDRFFTIHPRKGEIVLLDKKKGHLVQRSLGLVGLSAATSDTKGGGVMRTIDNNLLVGPDAYEQPLREDFSTHKENIDAILKKHLPLVKGLSPADVITYCAGVRACNYEEEFIVEASEYVENLVHAAAIQSPGLASAPAIAETIADITKKKLSHMMNVLPNKNFEPKRITGPHMSELSFEEKQRVIKANPDYGVIICRCEGISKGEIIDAVNSSVPAVSLDAVKRRVRPGMGRCQGGFCAPLVTKIISEQTGMSLLDITKNGDGSKLLTGKTPKGGAADV